MSSSAPSIAIFGPLGFVGQHVVPTFLSALQSRQISNLTLFTRNPSSSQFTSHKDNGAKIATATFDNKSSLTTSLRGHDVVISLMGTKEPSYKTNKEILIEAAAAAGVKVYIPSEYGTDHRDIRWENAMFKNKQEHQARAEKLGLKTVAIYTGLIMEIAFWKGLGFDTSTRTWSIIGPGTRPFAMTSQRDLGPLTLSTALLAHSTPSTIPSHLCVYSDNRSLMTYKSIFEDISGQKLSVETTSFEDANRDYESKRASIAPGMLGPLIPLLAADGSFDHTDDDGARELLNPGQEKWKWWTVDEYAREVRGRPWEEGSPW